MPDLAVLRALRYRPFRLLWLGQGASRLGDSMHAVALVWWVLQKTGSGLAMGTVVICQTVPMVLFALFGGVVVDRFDRLRIMLVADAVRAVITLLVAFFAYRGELEVWHVYIASVAFGFVEAFFHPAYLATVPRVTQKEDLPSANAVTSLSTQITRIAGPGLSAVCIAAAGTGLVFIIDAVTFVISYFFVIAVERAMLKEPLPDADDDFLGLAQSEFGGFTDFGTGFGGLGGGTVTFVRPQDMDLGDLSAPGSGPASNLRRVVDETREGFRFVFSRVYLWMPMLVFCLFNAFEYSAFTLAMPYLVTRVFKLDIGAFATLQTVAAVGFAIVTIILGQRAKLRRRGLLLFGAVFAAGVASLAIAAPITIYGVGVFVVVRAMACSCIELSFLNLFQEKVPADKLGRVFAIDNFLSMLLMPIGLAVVGWATDAFDPRGIFLASGGLVILISFGFRHREFRKLD